MIQAGNLRHRVTIMRPVRTNSPTSGEVRLSFEAVRDVWAEIRPLSAREIANYAQVQLLATHQVTMRYTPDIGGDYQLVYRGRTFNIVGPPIDVEERRAELRMTVSEDRSSG